MTKEQITKSIDSGILQLGRWDKFNYYFPTTALFFISLLFPAFWLYDQLIGPQKPMVIKPSDPVFIGFILIPFILGIVVFTFQKQLLRLTKINTLKMDEHNRKMIEEISNKLGWRTITNRQDIFIAVTNPPFWSGSWGERITVLYGNGVIWVNSICDPDKQSSLVSCGRNKANVRALIRKISNPSKKSFVT